MKNKEEPSAHSPRGNSWSQVHLPLQEDSAEDVGDQTRSSTLRPNLGGATVAACAKQPALSDSGESLMQHVVDSTNIEKAWKNVKANRGAPGPDGITIAEFPDWFQ